MVKIIHSSDLHLRNTIRHEEYIYIFEKLYSILRDEKPDLIVFCGDLAHTKCNISPEYVQMASDFLRNLANIAPTKLILGNHDKVYKNNNRLDAVSPVVNAINHPNLELFLKSGEYPFNDNTTLNVMNVFDRDNWIDPTNENNINIALYHGSISGCETDIGWTMENADDDVSIFKKMDYVMLGDIHKSNQQISEQNYEEIEIDEKEIEIYLKNGWEIV